MLTSEALKKIVAEARPLIEQQIDLAEQVAGLREVVTAHGGDWSQLKALVKAQIQDERDDAGDGKRVRKILDRADYANAYADMLGLGGANMNEKNFIPDHDPETGEVGEEDRHPIPEHTTAPDEPASEGAADDAPLPPRSNVETFATRTHNPATHFLNAKGLERLNGCLKPEACGSSQPRAQLCFSCSVQKQDGEAA